MSKGRDKRIFNATIAERFRTEAHERTKRYSRRRQLLDHLADILGGKETKRRGITVQEIGILLEYSLVQHWPLVKAVCDAVPGIRWNFVEFQTALVIRPSAVQA